MPIKVEHHLSWHAAMLFRPELKEHAGPDAGGHRAEPVHPGMAGGTECSQQPFLIAARAAVMNVRPPSVTAADDAAPAVPLENSFALSPEATS